MMCLCVSLCVYYMYRPVPKTAEFVAVDAEPRSMTDQLVAAGRSVILTLPCHTLSPDLT